MLLDKMGSQKIQHRMFTLFVFVTIVFSAFLNIYFSHASDGNVIQLDDTLRPVFIEEGELPVGDELVIYCPLSSDKKYHIYLIGDWVDFEDPMTDYDINIFHPPDVKIGDATASAGFPEQVSNDKNHQFFVPPSSGVYKFAIQNDASNSMDNKSAIFMILEHIELNKAYRTFLQGRTSTEDSYEGFIYYKCYEFNTNKSFFQVQVDVPDSLEMYEARLYRMASSDKDIGLTVEGLDIPEWEFLEGERVDGFGGFDYQHVSDITRTPELIASCDNFGQDIYINYEEEQQGEGDETYFYLVLLAEFGQGDVYFYVKDDVSPPKIDLTQPFGDLIYGEKNVFKVEVDSNNTIEEVWMEYSTDAWRTTESVDLYEEDGYWICELPIFGLHERVNFEIKAKDDLGNIGTLNDSKEVKKDVELDISLSDTSINSMETVNVEGNISLDNKIVELVFKNGDTITKRNVQTNSGSYQYEFSPTNLGKWVVYARYAGDAEYIETKTSNLEFDVQPCTFSLSAHAMKEAVRKDGKITIEGRTDPPLSGASLKVIYHELTETRKQVITDQSGSFTSSYVPTEVGTCQILVELEGEWRYGKVQSDLITVNVRAKSPIHIMIDLVYKATKPPLLYATIGIIIVIITVVSVYLILRRA